MPPEKFDKVGLALVEQRLEWLVEAVERIDHTLHGNGKKGLTERVALLEDADGRRTWRERAVIGAVLAAIGGGCVACVKIVARLPQGQAQGK